MRARDYARLLNFRLRVRATQATTVASSGSAPMNSAPGKIKEALTVGPLERVYDRTELLRVLSGLELGVNFQSEDDVYVPPELHPIPSDITSYPNRIVGNVSQGIASRGLSAPDSRESTAGDPGPTVPRLPPISKNRRHVTLAPTKHSLHRFLQHPPWFRIGSMPNERRLVLWPKQPIAQPPYVMRSISYLASDCNALSHRTTS